MAEAGQGKEREGERAGAAGKEGEEAGDAGAGAGAGAGAAELFDLSPLLSTQLADAASEEGMALCGVLSAIAGAVCAIWFDISTHPGSASAGTENRFGDQQLEVDISTDKAVFEMLRRSGLVDVACSEETPEEVELGGNRFSVTFDPLDGSSVIGANFAVGSIFGIWPPGTLLGRCGREQVASAVAVYGPRTTLAIGLPAAVAKDGQPVALELTLGRDRRSWTCSEQSMTVARAGKVFAPGNLRATADQAGYKNLVDYWIENKYTLRYTGGMVPDVYHILIKGKGVFTNVASASARAKLRYLYEVAPIGLLMECAGADSCVGPSDDFQAPMSVLDVQVENLDQRLGCCFGSAEEVERFRQTLF